MLSLFAASPTLVVPSRAGSITMADTSWRRKYDGGAGATQAPVNQSPVFSVPWGGAAAGGVAPVAAAPAAAAPSGAMSVVQAMDFFLATSGTVEAKSAFLESKGVDAFTIAQAACVSPTMYESFGPVQTEKYA